MRANSFLLSACSPVLHKMLCSGFIERYEKKLVIKDVDGEAFGKALDMWCGKVDCAEMELGEVKELASVADRFQITEVASALEDSVLKQLSVHMCGDVLNWSGNYGLRQLEAAAWKLATERFEELATTEGFMQMSEEVLGRLLDDDDLAARSEEAVWEAVAAWRAADLGPARGRGLVGKIRFPLMEEGYLRSRVVGTAPAEDAEWMHGVVAEALRARAARGDGGGFAFERLGPKALDRRVGLGVEWGECAEGGERRLRGHTADVWAVAECEGRVCSGSADGSIRVWRAAGEAAAEPERTLVPEGGTDCVYSLSAWEGRLISGHITGKLRVWSAATGACEQVLAGHAHYHAVRALAVCGSRLASGSEDASVRLWAMGAGAPWACERALLGHSGGVLAVAGWRGAVASGSADRTIRAWDAATGAHAATLAGHGGAVVGLAAHGDRLFSASRDGTIRAWAWGTWAALRAVAACGGEAGGFPRCVAVSGARLVCGAGGGGGRREVRVWGLEDLELQHALPQPAGADVWALLPVEGGVLAGVGSEVVVWRRRA